MKTASAVTGSEAFGVEGDVQIELGTAGPARTACWVGAQGEAFATGHEMGQVFVWMIPLDGSGKPFRGAQPICVLVQGLCKH